MNQKKIIFVIGPTAVGKTEVAFWVAKELAGEIVSCDSMQIYREISVVTSKPSGKVLQAVPHHLINIASVKENFDVAKFNQLALAAIQEIHQRNKIPLVVGGSGMYMQILLDGIFEDDEAGGDLREALKQRVQKEGSRILYEELAGIDQQAAEKIHPNDARRIVRALEVYKKQNVPISQLQRNRRGLWGQFDIRVFGLDRDREELYLRINRRVDEMFRLGLFEEISGIEQRDLSLTAQVIIGIQEIRGFLRGEYDLQRAKELMKQNTRRFAKRQLTWFRKEKRIQWIHIPQEASQEDIARQIVVELTKNQFV